MPNQDVTLQTQFTTEMLEALTAQHKAIDLLFSLLARKDPTFFPSKSSAWPALLLGNTAIKKAHKRLLEKGNHKMTDLQQAAKSARLMLYAWKGVRQTEGLPPHNELLYTIDKLEEALASSYQDDES